MYRRSLKISEPLEHKNRFQINWNKNKKSRFGGDPTLKSSLFCGLFAKIRYFRSKIRYFWLTSTNIMMVYRYVFVIFWKITLNLYYNDSQILVFSFKNQKFLTNFYQNHNGISTYICNFLENLLQIYIIMIRKIRYFLLICTNFELYFSFKNQLFLTYLYQYRNCISTYIFNFLKNYLKCTL